MCDDNTQRRQEQLQQMTVEGIQHLMSSMPVAKPCFKATYDACQAELDRRQMGVDSAGDGDIFHCPV